MSVAPYGNPIGIWRCRSIGVKRLVVLAAIVLAAGAEPSAAKRAAVLAVTHGSQGMSTLAWVDPLTLTPVAEEPLVRGRATWPIARSPGGRYLLTVEGGASRVLLRVVDLERGRATPTLTIEGATGANAVWSRPDRIVVITIRNGEAAKRLVLAPHPLRVLSRAALAGSLVGWQRAGARLVLLHGPPRRIGPLRLTLAGADGGLHTTTLQGLNGGWEGRYTADGYVSRHASHGLAVAPDGRRVAVVGPARYAVVDLADLQATVRPLAERRLQKRGEGWWREAVWLTQDRVAVTGIDYDAGRPEPSGLTLIDMKNGRTESVDASASHVSRRGSSLFAWGSGLASYDLDGTLRYRVADASIGDVAFAYGFVYVNDSRNRTSFRVLEAATGRLLGNATTAEPTTIVGPT
jgi:hypothetical protein